MGLNLTLVLSGGGAKALAHVGAWRALEEAGMLPQRIVGTSMGAVLGAALAAGVSHKAVRSVATGFTREEIAPVLPLSLLTGVFSENLLDPDALKQTIARMVPARWFSDLKIPLTVTVTDLDTGELSMFGAGGKTEVPLQEALYATCALPLYYPAATIATRRYGDGGLRAVLPLAVGRELAPDAELVIAVHVGPGFDEDKVAEERRTSLPPLVRAHGEAIRIMMAAQAEREIAEWPGKPKLVLVRPVREREATFRVEDGDRYIELGYTATKEAIA